MSTIEAAAAVESEYQSDALRELIESGEASPMHARDLLLALHAVRSEAVDVKALRDAIVERYTTKLQQLAQREAELVANLYGFIVNCNDGEKVAIPDAGTAYLTTKNKGGKLKVTDHDAFEQFVCTRFPQIVEAATVTTIEYGKALELAADTLSIIPTADGGVLNTTSGELVELPGIGAEPESKTLAVRKA